MRVNPTIMKNMEIGGYYARWLFIRKAAQEFACYLLLNKVGPFTKMIDS